MLQADEQKERMFFFSNKRGTDLLGFLHQPLTRKRDVGIVYCHPFAEEKNCSHAVVVKAARAFAKEGYAVLRFDLSGTGDSAGDLEDMTIDMWQDDLACAINTLKAESDIKVIVLWGLRFGAALAVKHHSESQEIAAHIVWHPISNFKDYIKQFLRQSINTELANAISTKKSLGVLVEKLERGEVLDVFGYLIREKLYASFLAADTWSTQNNGPMFIASVSPFTRAPHTFRKFQDDTDGLKKNYDYEHIVAEPFWDRYGVWNSPELIDKTLDWIKEEV